MLTAEQLYSPKNSSVYVPGMTNKAEPLPSATTVPLSFDILTIGSGYPENSQSIDVFFLFPMNVYTLSGRDMSLGGAERSMIRTLLTL